MKRGFKCVSINIIFLWCKGGFILLGGGVKGRAGQKVCEIRVKSSQELRGDYPF